MRIHAFLVFTTTAVLLICAAAAAGASATKPDQMASASPDCPYGTPIYEQDNIVKDQKTKKWVVARHVRAFRLTNSGAAFYESGLAIDADGTPNAYHPPNAHHPSGSPLIGLEISPPLDLTPRRSFACEQA
jgi:hypothetical protein